MIRIAALLYLFVALLSPQGAFAFTQGTPIPSDSRIKTFVYNENDVYRLLTHYGYQLNIEFSQDEKIQTISVGDRTGWQITPGGNRLFVRGMEDEGHTNMTVITDKRAYQFDLYSAVPGQRDWSELVYVVRFYYPEEERRRPLAAGAAPMGQMGGQPMMPGMGMMQPPMMQMPMQPMMQQPMMGGYYAQPAMPMMQQPMPQQMMQQPMMGGAPYGNAYGQGGFYQSPMQQPMMGGNPYYKQYSPAGVGAGTAPKPPPQANMQPRSGSSQFVAEIPQPLPSTPLPPGGFSFPKGYQQTGVKNMQYSYTGTKALLPDHMFDDGRNTFLYYPAHRRKPKLFAVGTDGSERPLPVRAGNQYLTISGVYSRLTLRMGDEHTCIYNEVKLPPPP